MTYCLGIKVNEGLVFASDSRTNAGLDNVGSYSKMFKFLKDVDDLSLSSGKSININLIKKVLDK